MRRQFRVDLPQKVPYHRVVGELARFGTRFMQMLDSHSPTPTTSTFHETLARSAVVLMEYENLFRLQNNRHLSVLESERALYPSVVKATIEQVLHLIECSPDVSEDRMELAATIRREFADALVMNRWDVKCSQITTEGDFNRG